ncbi:MULTISPECIES: helix-turn-helix domain-containing protein [Tenebrionibacter/Tenebrionicola group]|jgi:transcriptional regulator with XRE-family HTH domain|nr:MULTISPECIES: helix-turn-helix transcriptional regulator [Tenebrionibacter/Tenebrionicola group]
MRALFPWRVITMDFGKRLAALRKDRKLTQAALAEKVGCHVTMIRRYESDEVQPTLEIIRKLSRALSVSADTLVFDEAERNPDEELRLQFEAVSQFSPEEKEVARVLLESLILKHDSTRFARNR